MSFGKKLAVNLAALSSTVLVLVALTSGIVSAASPGAFCSRSDGACLSAGGKDWKAGSAVVTSTTIEYLYTPAINFCDAGTTSVVQTTCPFAAGSGFNTKFKGKSMVEIHWGGYSTCLGITKADVVVSANCQTGQGVLWVQAGKLKTDTGLFINRYATNKSRKEMVMTAPSSVGGKVTVKRYAANNTAQEWGFKAKPIATPKSTTKSTQASCYPLSDEATCYEPGEYCRDDDHGASGIAGDGKSIVCEDNNGWRWESN